MIIRDGDGKDVTDEIMGKAEALRMGPIGQAQRATVFGALTQAINAIAGIVPPWLDDCVWETRSALEDLRKRIPRD